MAFPKSQVVTETMSDEELAKLAREGCEEAFSLLVHRCAPMVRRQAASICSQLIETDDLAQEGMLGLLSAVRSYDSGAASFRTFASVCVRNRILTAVKRTGAARLIPVSEIVSMDEEEESSVYIAGGEDPAQLVVQKEEDYRLLGRLHELLSPKEYSVLMLYLQAYAYDEIAQHMTMSFKSVDNALQRVRRKLVSASLMGS